MSDKRPVLPPNFLDRLPSMSSAVNALRAVEGEEVNVFLGGRVLQLSGKLSVGYAAAPTEGGVLVGIGPKAVLVLSEEKFESAILETFDGSSYFRITINIGGLSITFADIDST